MSNVQRCVHCDDPTGRCAEDSLFDGDRGPLCEACHDSALNQELDRLRAENATLRALVREALPIIRFNAPLSKAESEWIERAEKALANRLNRFRPIVIDVLIDSVPLVSRSRSPASVEHVGQDVRDQCSRLGAVSSALEDAG
jgi:hypothetical protein